MICKNKKYFERMTKNVDLLKIMYNAAAAANIIIIIIIFIFFLYSLRVFHISFSWWSFTGVLVTASLLKSWETLLSILGDLNRFVVWMVSTHPPTAKSSSPFNNPLVIVPKASIMIDIIVTFMFHNFFNSLARSRYLSFSLYFYSVVSRVHNFASPLFFVDYYKVYREICTDSVTWWWL